MSDSLAEIREQLNDVRDRLREINKELEELSKVVPNLQIEGSVSKVTRGFSRSYPIFGIKDAKITSML